jgi:hypothetical protein
VKGKVAFLLRTDSEYARRPIICFRIEKRMIRFSSKGDRSTFGMLLISAEPSLL